MHPEPVQQPNEQNQSDASAVGGSDGSVLHATRPSEPASAAITYAGSVDLPPPEHRVRWSPLRPVLYPNIYVWFVFLAALDIICTWMILNAGGAEVNWLAEIVIHHGGLWGTSAYKFGLVMLIVLVCEFVGRRRYSVGRRLAQVAVFVTCVPVVVAVWQMLSVVAHYKTLTPP